MLPGCATLRVKLAVRDFSRSARRADRAGMARHSTRAFRQGVLERLPEELLDLLKRRPGRSGSGGGSGRASAKAKGIRVRVSGRRAWLTARVAGLQVTFRLLKEGGWRVDDLEVSWRDGRQRSVLRARRDVGPLLAAFRFYRALRSGRRDALLAASGGRLRREVWRLVPDWVLRRLASRSSDGASKGPSERVVAVRFERRGPRACFVGVRTSARRQVGLSLRLEAGRWVVADLFYSEPPGRLGPRRLWLLDAAAAARAAARQAERLLASRLLAVGKQAARASTPSHRAPGDDVPWRQLLEARVLDWSFDGRTVGLDAELRGWRVFVRMVRGRTGWVLGQARFGRGDRSVLLSEALAFRDVLARVVRAVARGDLAGLREQSASELDRSVWARLGSVADLRKRLEAGGLNELLGFAVLPKGMFGRLGFAARLAGLVDRLAAGRVRIEEAWSERRAGIRVGGIRFRIGTVPVEVHFRWERGAWRLADVTWVLAGRTLSFRERASRLLGRWHSP